MRILITHPSFEYFEAVQGISVASKGQIVTLSPSKVEELCVALTKDMVNLISLTKAQNVVHWYGESAFHSQTLETAREPRGLVLVSSNQVLHLIYVARQRFSTGFALFHQMRNDTWSLPCEITSYVDTSLQNYVAQWGMDGNLHLVYVHNVDGRLHYRVYDTKTQSWSGAIPLSKKSCGNPLLFCNDSLHLVWVEESEQGIKLKYRCKKEEWSQEEVLSSDKTTVYDPAWFVEESHVGVLWMQNGTLCRRWLTKKDTRSEELLSSSVTRQRKVFVNPEDGSNTTLDYFVLREEELPIETKEEVMVSKNEVQLERELLEQAFRVQSEWDSFRQSFSRELLQKDLADPILSAVKHRMHEMGLDFKEQITGLTRDLGAIRLELEKMKDGSKTYKLERRVEEIERNQTQQRTRKSQEFKDMEQKLALLERELVAQKTAKEELSAETTRGGIVKRFFSR